MREKETEERQKEYTKKMKKCGGQRVVRKKICMHLSFVKSWKERRQNVREKKRNGA